MMRDRVNQRLAELGLNASEAARRGGLERSFVKDLLLEKKRSVRGVGLLRLAYALQVSPAWLTGHADEMGSPPDISSLPPEHGTDAPPAPTERPEDVELLGFAEAGVFREIALADPPRQFPKAIPRVPEYPDVRQVAVIQRGDSMDQRCVVDGSLVIGVDYGDFVERYGGLSEGMVLIVRRTRDDGHEVEISLRRYHVTADGPMLIPESSNPKHRSIRCNDPDVEIVAVARVSAIFLF